VWPLGRAGSAEDEIGEGAPVAGVANPSDGDLDELARGGFGIRLGTTRHNPRDTFSIIVPRASARAAEHGTGPPRTSTCLRLGESKRRMFRFSRSRQDRSIRIDNSAMLVILLQTRC